MAEEKRKDKRIQEDFGVLFKAFQQIELEGIVSHITDISKSGLSFLIDNKLVKNDILQLTFRVPPDFKEKVEIYARTVDCQPEIQGGFKIRAAFIDIDPKARAILSRLIEQASFKEILKNK